MSKKPFQTIILLLVAVAVTGCVTSRTGDVYTRNETRQVMTVEFGVIEYIRSVVIEGTSGAVGTTAGAIVGGIAGSNIGGGRGAAIATILGAVVGGVIGSSIEEDVTRADGLEITVRLESGAIRAYVQEVGLKDDFRVGDQVRIVRRGGVARVTR